MRARQSSNDDKLNKLGIPEDKFDASAREDSIFSAGLLAELDLDIALSNDYPGGPLLTEALGDVWADESWVDNVSDTGYFDLTSSQSYVFADFCLDDESQGL
ncbi:hypothetical protein K4K49_010037 [Colletotrichum sp. SAR 10_70]|nr:hypothetical protein K4K50_009239 [Colletotrichum sp. SAR 10_71]KAI8194133.1 hypothetical protein K4K49_010037 [Colletotrichum sp. SAR 10_70]